jgi:hypothetical protein
MNNNVLKNETTSAHVRRLNKKFYKFYFVHPPKNADADHLAEQLIGIRNVEEVFVTDGDYGFVVKTRFFVGEEPDDVFNYISKKLGSNFGRATNYYQYKK